mmetsp:Transcript_27806/g.96216  ORF Transcript_27806/g.96216 Transcript_27806/m.96216 type:complete len:270 (+) Transcript_27806:191-1000(+)
MHSTSMATRQGAPDDHASHSLEKADARWSCFNPSRVRPHTSWGTTSAGTVTQTRVSARRRLATPSSRGGSRKPTTSISVKDVPVWPQLHDADRPREAMVPQLEHDVVDAWHPSSNLRKQLLRRRNSPAVALASADTLATGRGASSLEAIRSSVSRTSPTAAWSATVRASDAGMRSNVDFAVVVRSHWPVSVSTLACTCVSSTPSLVPLTALRALSRASRLLPLATSSVVVLAAESVSWALTRRRLDSGRSSAARLLSMDSSIAVTMQRT